MPFESSTIWTQADRPERPPATGRAEADVVVVGGGIAGITAALVLAREGLDVVVLEARRIGAGTTGRTTAKVSALQGLRYRTLARTHGASATAAYARAQLAALAWIGEAAETGSIDCRWERRPALTYATDEQSRREVEEERDAAAAAGLAAELTDPLLPFETTGAVVVPDQAQFDPQAYLDGLARELDAIDGAIIHERSRVRSIKGRGPHRVVTDDAEVVAPTVIVATLLPIVDRGLFFARAEPKASYTLAVDFQHIGILSLEFHVDKLSRPLL